MKFEKFKNKLLKDKEFAKQYQSTQLAFDIAKKIIIARTDKGLTQAELAEKIGTKQPSIARIESGTHLPSLKLLSKISRVLETDIPISEWKDREDFTFKVMYSDGEITSFSVPFEQTSTTSSTKKEKIILTKKIQDYPLLKVKI